MQFDNNELIEIAFVVKPHGLKGHLSIKFIEKNSAKILKKDYPVFLNISEIPVPFFIEEIKSTDVNTAIIKLKHINCLETINKYNISSIYVISKDIKAISNINTEEDSEYVSYEVFDKRYGFIGNVIHLNLIPGNPVIEIEYNQKTIILPFSDNFIEKIDHKNKKIHIISPEGLISLYLE